MRCVLLGMLAETFIHPGTGQTDGAVDLRVAREAATDYPFIPGSGVKGAIRDFSRTVGAWTDDEEGDGARGQAARVFGRADSAGRLVFGDARLLLLPVRSLSGAYKWVTCPHLVERLLRDMERAGKKTPDMPSLGGDLAGRKDEERPWILAKEGSGVLFLEERLLTVKGQVPDAVIDLLQRMIVDRRAAARLADQLVLVSDDQFAGLARMGLAITARNKLNETTKSSEALWYEESIPPDAVLYTLVTERLARDEPLAALCALLETRPYMQLGGNETTGQGWFKLKTVEGGP